MRYSILGFNQQLLTKIKGHKTIKKKNKETEEIKLQLDLTDILIMDYINSAIGSPKMKRIEENDLCYVWLKHSKIIEDLPILRIKENMLAKRLGKLVTLNILAVKTINNSDGRGSKSYYAKTELFESLLNSNSESDVIDYKQKQEPDVIDYKQKQEPDVIDYKSNKQLNYNTNTIIISNNKLLDNNNAKSEEISSNFNFGFNKPKRTKIPKYLACINDFTTNEELKDVLVTYYKYRNTNATTRISSGDYIELLQKLKEITSDENYMTEIVKRTTEGNGHRPYRVWVEPGKSVINNNYQKSSHIYWKDDYNLDEDSYKRSEEKF